MGYLDDYAKFKNKILKMTFNLMTVRHYELEVLNLQERVHTKMDQI